MRRFTVSSREASYWLSVVALGLVVGVSIQFARAWTNPTDAPPGGNVAGPLTTGAVNQTKSAGLGLTGSLMIAGGLVQVGQTSATCDSSLGGALRYNSTKKCIEFCDESAWKCSSVATVIPPYTVVCGTDSHNPYAYCNGSDTRVSCTDTGHGSNHWVTPISPNGCQASEGAGNGGAPGCMVTCQGQ